jgi:hypothetical protein
MPHPVARDARRFKHRKVHVPFPLNRNGILGGGEVQDDSRVDRSVQRIKPRISHLIRQLDGSPRLQVGELDFDSLAN